MSWRIKGRLVTMPLPLGRKSRPTIFSRTEDFPDDCEPTTTYTTESDPREVPSQPVFFSSILYKTIDRDLTKDLAWAKPGISALSLYIIQADVQSVANPRNRSQWY